MNKSPVQFHNEGRARMPWIDHLTSLQLPGESIAVEITEGVLLGLGGAVLGAAVALLISSIVNRLGLEWLPPGSAEPLPLILRVWGEPGMILGTTLGLIVIATLSAWWPAYRAARLNVVDALRHV